MRLRHTEPEALEDEEEAAEPHPPRTRFTSLLPTLDPGQDPGEAIDEELPGSAGLDVEPIVEEGQPFVPPHIGPGPRAGAEADYARVQRRALHAKGADREFMLTLPQAEERYAGPDEQYNEVGVPVSPFHLRREREEGMIDAEGFYLEGRQGETDAWLASLEEDPLGQDDGRPFRHPGRPAIPPPDPVAESPPLPPTLLAGYQRQLVAALHPGETVPAALRRLAGAGPAFASKFGSRAEADEFWHCRMRSGHTVPPGNQDLFDALTEAAEVLFDHGFGDVYSAPREALAVAAAPTVTGPPSKQGGAGGGLGGRQGALRAAAGRACG